MSVTLRKALDDAGFRDVKIHMHNPPTLAEVLPPPARSAPRKAVWKTIDYATSNVYDYQGFSTIPMASTRALREMKEAIGEQAIPGLGTLRQQRCIPDPHVPHGAGHGPVLP